MTKKIKGRSVLRGAPDGRQKHRVKNLLDESERSAECYDDLN